MAVALVFVDGVGVGRRDLATNPLAHRRSLLSHFDDGSGSEMPWNGAWAPVDANLGFSGRPQSPTGQATIYTGQNAPSFLGQHLVGFPNSKLRQLIHEHSLFLQLARRGRVADFANGYPRPYLEALHLPYRGPRADAMEIPHNKRRLIQPSASTCAASRVGFLRTWEDVQAGDALVHDISGQRGRWHALVPPRTPHEAAAILLELQGESDFVLFEHFLLDEAGHDQSLPTAIALLDELDLFLRAVAAGLRPGDHLFVVSDHGNVEDVSTRSHTRNPVPFLCFGPDAARIAQNTKSLQDVAGAVLGAV